MDSEPVRDLDIKLEKPGEAYTDVRKRNKNSTLLVSREIDRKSKSF